jgi:hypothetical protein
MHHKFQTEYRKFIAEKKRENWGLDTIRPALLDHRELLLQKVSQRLKERKGFDVAYVLGSTVCNTAVPYSGLAVTMTYVTKMCRSFSKDMGIVTSMKKATKEVAKSSGEAMYLEILKNVLKDAVSDEIVHQFIPIPGVAMLLMPCKWIFHREHREEIINKILDKAMKYHESWIVEELEVKSS